MMSLESVVLMRRMKGKGKSLLLSPIGSSWTRDFVSF
jgi:hypothetical protein